MSQVCSPFIKKRLLRETNKSKKYKNYDLFFKDRENYKSFLAQGKDIQAKIHYDNVIIKFGLNYPFNPPNVFIKKNNEEKSYIYYLSDISQKYSKGLKKKNIICLCCDSILCANKWSPAFTYENIISEYIYIENIIKELNYENIITEICNSNKIYCDSIMDRILSFTM